MTHTAAGAARSLPMSDETRGHTIKERRLALGFKSLREFAEKSGIDREALSKAERGQGSSGTYDRVEAWLSRFEEETGHDEPSTEPLRFTFHDVYGIGEIIAEGGNSEELVAAVTKLFREMRITKGPQE